MRVLALPLCLATPGPAPTRLFVTLMEPKTGKAIVDLKAAPVRAE